MPRAKKAADAPSAEGEEGFESGAVFADGSAPVKQDMWEDGEREGDDDGPPPEAPSVDLEEEAKQASYLASAPEWAVLPPRNSDFANATWLEAEEASIIRLVSSIFGMEEFAALGQTDYVVRWRRNSKPVAAVKSRPPLFITATPVDPRSIWEAEHQGCETFPRLFVDLHFQNFEDRRNVSPFYVHRDEVAAHLHHALSALDVKNDRLARVGPDVAAFAKTNERFPGYQHGMRALRRSMMLMPEDDDEDEGQD